MPKASKPGYYAVRIGRAPGIYHSWADCEAQIKGFAGAVYKKLSTEAEAIEFMTPKTGAARNSTSRDVPCTSQAVVVPKPNAHPAADEQDCDIVYCDGACKGNGQAGSIAGVGVWWGHGDPRNITERCPGDQTNNRAELVAIVRILETTPQLKRRLLIKTDSNYSIQCVTSWIFKWMRNGFLAADGKPVKNRALIKYLAALLHARRKTSQTIDFKHVRGHVGIEGNEAADKLANLGATKPLVLERNWEQLEREILSDLEHVKLIEVVDDGLKAYADGLLKDDDLVGLADVRVGEVAPPVQEPGRQDPGGMTRNRNRLTVVPQTVFPPLISASGSTVARPTSSAHNKNKLVGNTVASSTVMAFGSQTTASKQPAAAVSQDELEVCASCLLGDDELSTLGKDGVFDSDF